jgi:hypothetical protein
MPPNSGGLAVAADEVDGERHQVAAALTEDHHRGDRVLGSVRRLDPAQVLADAKLIDRFAKRA